MTIFFHPSHLKHIWTLQPDIQIWSLFSSPCSIPHFISRCCLSSFTTRITHSIQGVIFQPDLCGFLLCVHAVSLYFPIANSLVCTIWNLKNPRDLGDVLRVLMFTLAGTLVLYIINIPLKRSDCVAPHGISGSWQMQVEEWMHMDSF